MKKFINSQFSIFNFQLCKGVTLVELMLSIGILMVLFAVGLISVGKMETDSGLDEITSSLKTTLIKAQNNCLNNLSSGLYFNSNKYTFFYGNIYNPADPKNEVTNLPREITFVNINLPSQTLTFEKITGYVKNFSTPANITIKDASGQQKIININKLGTITVN